ncbi:hypothetical protein B0H17DRAFT_1130182 [Mycena rosella]|uniref:Uncharacterized protein n=1 Tax=Mycena rosella TaxID=1033263 RepID=A0AAD7DSC5_MYCRO|nr:hypothetical protein B0H17DRAFT_1130182 [Mycena rosella]
MDSDGSTSQWVVPFTPHRRNSSISSAMSRMMMYSPAGQSLADVPPNTPTYTGFSASAQPTPFNFLPMKTPQSGVSPHTTTERRRQNSHLRQATANDENIDPSPSNSSQKHPKTSSTSTSHSQSGSQRQSVRTEAEKMKNVLNSIKSQGWSLAEFLYMLFRPKEEEAAPRSTQHSQMVSKLAVIPRSGDGD